MCKNLVDVNAIRWLLADGEWTSASDMIDRCRNFVPPEKASQFYLKHRGNDIEADYPEDYVVQKGIETMIVRAMGHLLGKEIESAGGRQFIGRKFRWTAWHCRLCGVRVIGRPDYPADGLCDNCKKQSHKERQDG